MRLGLGRRKGNSLFRLCPQPRLLQDLSKQPREGNDGQEEMLTCDKSLSTRVRVCLITHTCTCTKVLNFHTVIRNWRDGERESMNRERKSSKVMEIGRIDGIRERVSSSSCRRQLLWELIVRVWLPQFSLESSNSMNISLDFLSFCSLSSRYSMMAFPSFPFGFVKFSRVIIPLSNCPLLLFCILTQDTRWVFDKCLFVLFAGGALSTFLPSLDCVSFNQHFYSKRDGNCSFLDSLFVKCLSLSLFYQSIGSSSFLSLSVYSSPH